MIPKPDFNTDKDLAEIIQRVSEARPYRLKKADYLEIAKSLAIGSVEVVKGAVCVAAVVVTSVDLSEAEESNSYSEATILEENFKTKEVLYDDGTVG